MPGAPSDWCPWWFEYYESATLLQVPPWELAGFTFASAADAPHCWRYWALEVLYVKGMMNARRQQSMLGAFGGQ